MPGSAVTVLYEAGAPTHAKWKSNRIWEFPLLLGFMFLLGIRASFDPRFGRGERARNG